MTKGFTLIEILAALLLIGLVLPPVMKGISIVRVIASEADCRYEALNLAETKLSEVLLEESWENAASQSGQYEDEYERYSWNVSVSDWTESGVMQIEVCIAWQQRNRSREVVLSTLVYDEE